MKKRKLLLALCGVLCAMVLGVVVTACGNTETPGNHNNLAQTVVLDRTSLSMEKFEQITLVVTADPPGEAEWSTSDDRVVTVANGVVTAVNVGNATVKVVVGGKEAICEIVVGESSYVPVLTLNRSSLELLPGSEFDVTAIVTYLGDEYTDVEFSYETEDKNVAIVSASGKVTAVAVGKTRLIVSGTWRGERLTRSIEVSVKADANLVVSFEGNTIEKLTLRKSLPSGTDDSYINEAVLNAVAYEQGAQVYEATVGWKTENEDVVSVTSDGKVQAVGVGKTRIVAEYTTRDGAKIKSYVAVNVVLPDVDLGDEPISEVDIRDAEKVVSYPASMLGTAQKVVSENVNVAKVGEHGMTFNADWLNAVTLGIHSIQIHTDEAIYYSKISLTESYRKLDISQSGSLFGIVDTKNKGVYTKATESVGGKDNVWHFASKEASADAWQTRLDLMGSTDTAAMAQLYKANFKYIAITLYLPTGSNAYFVHGYGSGNTLREIKISDGLAVSGDFEFCMDGNGNRLKQYVADTWMTLVFDLDALVANSDRQRFFIGAGGWYAPAEFYLESVCYYTENGFKTPNISYDSEIRFDKLEQKTADIKAYLGTSEITEIIASSDNQDVATVFGKTITAVGNGTAHITWTCKNGEETVLTVTTTVTVLIPTARVEILFGSENIDTITLRTSLPEGVDPNYIVQAQLVGVATENGSAVDDAVFTWLSLNTDVATVENGLVRAVGTGRTFVKLIYMSTFGEEYTVDIEVNVVLPDVLLGTESIGRVNIHVAEKLNIPVDITETVVAVEKDGVSIGKIEDGKIALDIEWLSNLKVGQTSIELRTENVVYVVNIELFETFHSVNITATNDAFNIVGGNYSLSSAGIGGKTNVGYYNDASASANVWASRLDLMGANTADNAKKYKENYKYAVLSLYVPAGKNAYMTFGYGAGSPTLQEIKIAAGLDVASVFALCLDSQGNRLTKYVSDAWMTLVFDLDQLQLSTDRQRFIIGSGGWAQPATFYLEYLRFYKAENFDLINFVVPERIDMVSGDSLDVTVGVYCGFVSVQTVEVIGEIDNDGVASISGKIVRALTSGIAYITWTCKEGDNVLFTGTTVLSVASEINAIEIDVNGTGVVSSDEIEGEIQSVLYNGKAVSDGAVLTREFILSIGKVATAETAPERKVLIKTTTGFYGATLRFTGEYDSLSFGMLSRKESYVRVSDVTNSLDTAIVGDREEVYSYTSSAKVDDTWGNMWAFREGTTENFLTTYTQGYTKVKFDVYYLSGNVMMYVGNPVEWTSATTKPEFIDSYQKADNTMTDSLVKGEWITVSLDIEAMRTIAGVSGRFGFTAKTAEGLQTIYFSNLRLIP